MEYTYIELEIEQVDKKKKLLYDIFGILGYKVSSLAEICELTISQDKLKHQSYKEKLYERIDDFKKQYKSEMLTCLHKNSLEKQIFPAVNMIRQICKCNGLKVYPYVVSKGYNKMTGKKITERYYRIMFL